MKKLKKSFGQNLLVDKSYLNKIIESVEVSKNDEVLEIGAGSGILTLELSKKAKKIYAVEIERDILKQLKENIKKENVSNVAIIEKSILSLNNFPENKFLVIGNVPYNISSLILIKFLGEIDNPSSLLPRIKKIYLMLQKEVAERLVAKPSTKAYSPLSILVQYFSSPKILFYVPRNAFFPIPKVESAFIELEILKNPIKIKDPGFLKKVVRIAFQQRRKTLINSLSKIFPDKENIKECFKSLGFNEKLRPENLSLEEYVMLTEQLTH